jgi:4-hydroxy-tetrahydrodipicolinate reductase
MMRIALVGYGKMGKAIERIALGRGHEISARVDADPSDIKQLEQGKHDTAIEFSIPEIAASNIKRCIELGIPVLSGTTGWLSQKSIVEDYCQEKGGTFFYASNYSLGVNLFFKLNEYLAQLISRYPEYSVSLEEIHHTQKKDAPSGTAITLAEGILKYSTRKTGWALHPSEKPNEIGIQSKRIDPYPGEHTVTYRSAIDDIEIKHTAHSREGFALGAVLVAEWLMGKKGVFGMEDFMEPRGS